MAILQVASSDMMTWAMNLRLDVGQIKEILAKIALTGR
jgi:hypothetical protein